MTPVIRDYAKRGVGDKPDGGHKSHFEPMPVGGGVAIYACLLFSLASLLFHTAVSDQLWANAYLVLRCCCSGAMRWVRLWDDSKNLKPG
jgi:UDP-N-acetylmuramyl pentapeptide phosphotransferase/UDP-N-acetylglucosamine-1-phosphate transferase